MYENPVLLPQVSNREDFLLTVQLYDDDTFQPIDLANSSTFNQQAFTGAAWTVQDGAIVTTSTTSITISAFPIGSQLNALSLTVGTGLAILAGDSIEIFDTATGLNTMTGYVTSYVSATGALVAQIGWTFQLVIKSVPPNWTPDMGYTVFYDFGTGPQQPILQASLGAGTIKVVDLGTFEVRIPESTFRSLCSGTYGIFCSMTDGYNTRQLFVGRVPVIYGGVNQ